jgi:hypothetical protein
MVTVTPVAELNVAVSVLFVDVVDPGADRVLQFEPVLQLPLEGEAHILQERIFHRYGYDYNFHVSKI